MKNNTPYSHTRNTTVKSAGRGMPTSRSSNQRSYKTTSIDNVHSVRPRPAKQPGLPLQFSIKNRKETKLSSVVRVKPSTSKVGSRSDASTVSRTTPKRSNVLHRSNVSKPAHPLKDKKSQLSATHSVANKKRISLRKSTQLLIRPRFVVTFTALLITFGLVGGGAAVYVNGLPLLKNTSDGSSEVLSESVQTTSSTTTTDSSVSEERPDKTAINSHSVSANAPRILRLGTIGLEARIKPTKIDIGNHLELPGNIFDVGWYEGSREPGKPGAVLISGYVSGPSDRGAFYYLRTLEKGDIVEIETGAGEVFRYEVQDRRYIPYDEINIAELIVPSEAGKKMLHLAAFDNRYNILSESFQDRLVVYASQL